jgi:signal transduction histidine kinase
MTEMMDDGDLMTVDDAHAPIRHSAGDRAVAVYGSISALVAFVVFALWVVTTRGYFWPAWVWFGLAVPLVAIVALRSAWHTPPGRPRRLALHGALTGWICAILISVWALAGGGFFWPLIPVVCVLMLLALHTVLSALMAKSPREQALVERVDELTRTRRGALDVQAAELRRIERDLHDGAQARLVALSMQLGRAEERLEDRPEVADLVRRARGEASAAIAELRDLARGIAPPVLADRGLAAAVEALGRRSALPVTVDVELEQRPLPVVETAAYFVVAETLTNAAKHARGASATVTIRERGSRLVVEVSDDGPGGADPDGGGLTGLRHRVEALDGTLGITSTNRGTTVIAELPCGS